MGELSDVRGYALLSEGQQRLLERTYKRHMSAFGTDTRTKYAVEQVKEVKWDAKEKSVNIYFKDGKWWHYDLRGEWY